MYGRFYQLYSFLKRKENSEFNDKERGMIDNYSQHLLKLVPKYEKPLAVMTDEEVLEKWEEFIRGIKVVYSEVSNERIRKAIGQRLSNLEPRAREFKARYFQMVIANQKLPMKCPTSDKPRKRHTTAIQKEFSIN